MGSAVLTIIMGRYSLLFCIFTTLAWFLQQGQAGTNGVERLTDDQILDQANTITNVRSIKTKRGQKQNGQQKRKYKSSRRQKSKGKEDKMKSKKTKGKAQSKKQKRKIKHLLQKEKSREKQRDKKKTKKKIQKDKKKIKMYTKQTSCPTSAPVPTKCLENAMISLKYEKNQVTNYLKQSKRLSNHQNISSNKLNKQDEFQSAAKHMLWAIGGNISDPKCGAADESKRAINVRGLAVSVENYNTLLNCSESMKEAC